MDYKAKKDKKTLRNNLDKLDKQQFKLFFTIIVHYWVSYKYFINKGNFFNLWCELNELCHKTDGSFPDQHTDHELVKSYCHDHPYYFIDILDLGLVKKLFCQYLDDRLDVLTTMVQKLDTEGIRGACECADEALGLAENVDELVAEIEEHIRVFS